MPLPNAAREELWMQKKAAYIFLGVSLTFFLFMVGFTGYRIEAARTANLHLASQHAQDILGRAAAEAEASGGLRAPAFKQRMRELFNADPRLLVLAVHSEEDGIIYLISRNREYLREPPEPAPDWRGTPSYNLSRGYETLVSLPFDDPDAAVWLDAAFVTLGREDLFPVVRDDLYLFLAFLLACGVVLVILMGIGEDPAARPPAPGTRPAPGAPVQESPRPQRSEAGRSMTSPRTGLVWAEHFAPRIKSEIERAASSDLDLSIARITIDHAPSGDGLETLTAALAKVLKEAFPVGDLAFESGPGSLALILPDMDVDQAARSLDTFRRSAAPLASAQGARLSIGVSSRGGRLVDAATLVDEAVVAARKASNEGGNRVIGFRADPARFRQTLSAPAG
jgi:GGDEF domain-containing protein